ncbi:MAG: pilin [Patescibacteria group bacterium]
MKSPIKKLLFPSCLLLFLFLASATGNFAIAEEHIYGYANPIPHYSITSLIQSILVSLQNIVGILTVILIVIGGIVYITSGGKEDQIKWAKNIITNSLIGFALVVGAPSLLKEIKDIIASGEDPQEGLIDNANSIGDILMNVLNFALTAIGVLALLSFIIAGIIYLTSAGDKSKTDKAKKTVVYSAVAVAVAGSGIILINQIIAFLDATA